jgi:hypothetical protein
VSSLYRISIVTSDFILQNVAGRTLVGLRFWNQVRMPVVSQNTLILIDILLTRWTMMGRAIGYSKVET